MGRLFARETGGRVIDGPDSVPEEEMFHAWNAAQASGTPLLIVADTPPSEWHVALPDLASRLRAVPVLTIGEPDDRSAEHTSELQSLMRISYAVLCLKKKIPIRKTHT